MKKVQKFYKKSEDFPDLHLATSGRVARSENRGNIADRVTI